MTINQLRKRVEFWQGKLGLEHWRIECITMCTETEGGPHAAATVHTAAHYDSCDFQFTYDLIEQGPWRLDVAIVHEWLHVLMRDLDETFNLVERWMPEAAYSNFEDTVDHAREGLVERLARAIVALERSTS